MVSLAGNSAAANRKTLEVLGRPRISLELEVVNHIDTRNIGSLIGAMDAVVNTEDMQAGGKIIYFVQVCRCLCIDCISTLTLGMSTK